MFKKLDVHKCETPSRRKHTEEVLTHTHTLIKHDDTLCGHSNARTCSHESKDCSNIPPPPTLNEYIILRMSAQKSCRSGEKCE